MQCVICKHGKTGSKEHIIPKAMGNENLTTNLICTSCNSKLGCVIDDYFTNHIIIKILRDAKNWRGESGKEIKVFPKVAVDVTSGKKFMLDNDKAHIVPSVSETNGILTVEAEDIEIGLKIASVKLKRMGYTDESIEKIIKNNIQKEKTEQLLPKFKLNADIHIGKFLLLPLKIAYEYLYYRFGEAIKGDDTVEKIRNELYNAIYKQEENDYDFITTHAQLVGQDAIDILEEVKKIAQKDSFQIRHLIVLHKTIDDQLVCEVYMGMEAVISFSVLLMETIPNDVQINDTYITIITEDGAVLNI